MLEVEEEGGIKNQTVKFDKPSISIYWQFRCIFAKSKFDKKKKEKKLAYLAAYYTKIDKRLDW